MLTRALAAVALMVPGLSGAAQLPDFTATYALSRGALTVGTARVSLTREADGGYHYESYSWPSRWGTWLRKDKLYETSSGRLDADGIRPEKYHYLRTGGSKERVAHLSFNRDKHEVVNNVAGSRWKMAILPGTQDKLSTRLSMMQALARGETDFTFNVADGGTLKRYRFRVRGKETLEVPAGTFKTVKVMEQRGNKKRKTWIWCAPELGYLPVQIHRREKDDTAYYSQLESFSESLRVEAGK